MQAIGAIAAIAAVAAIGGIAAIAAIGGTAAVLSCSKKVSQSQLLWVLGRKSAGGTKPNGPQGGRWVC